MGALSDLDRIKGVRRARANIELFRQTVEMDDPLTT